MNNEAYEFSKHKNTEENRNRAAFAFLKNINLGNEKGSLEKKQNKKYNKVNEKSKSKEEKENLENENNNNLNTNNNSNKNSNNNNEKNEEKNNNNNTKPFFFLEENLENDNKIDNKNDNSKIFKDNKDDEMNINLTFPSVKQRRNTLGVNKSTNEINNSHNFKLLWSNMRRDSFSQIEKTSQVFGRIHSLSDLTELNKQISNSNKNNNNNNGNSSSNPIIERKQYSLNVLTTVEKDKRQIAAQQFLANINLVPNKDTNNNNESRKKKYNIEYDTKSSIHSATHFTLIKGNELRICDVENRNNQKTEMLNNVLNNIQMYTTKNNSILGTFSVLNPRNYKEDKIKIMSGNYKNIRLAKQQGKDISFKLPNLQIRKRAAESYAKLLVPSHSLEKKPPENFHQIVLDDPALITGKHKTIIALPYFMSSIIQYSRPSDLKRELNEQYRQLHPDLDPSLTLTQIRKVKKNILLSALEMDLELSSIAKAYVYFEKLILKKAVNKYNRRLIGATCLFLATKVNDPKEVSYSQLLKVLNKIMDVSPKEIRENEFNVFVSLEFVLYVPLWEVRPQFERLVTSSECSNVDMDDYLIEDIFYDN